MRVLWLPAQLFRQASLLWLIVLPIAMSALLLRLYELGLRAMHHDESLHATYSWYLAEGHGYEHSPLMHGPLLFHALAGVFVVLGENEVTTRLPFAIAGTALVLTPLLLRRWLGTSGVVIVSLMLAISPVLLYYSRFARNDVLAALWTVLLIIAIWRYRNDGRDRWLVLGGGALALSFATKETAYLVVAMALIYLNAGLTMSLLDQALLQGKNRLYTGIMLFPIAWLVAIFWRPLRRRFGWNTLPRDGDMLIVIGTLTAPFLVAVLQFPFRSLEQPHFETMAILVMMSGAVCVGALWSLRRWLPIASMAALITVPLFTTWFTNADGFQSGFWGQLDYWFDQHEVKRGNQPGFYYLMLLPIYEFLTLIPALVGGLWLLWRGDQLMRLLVWWFLALLVALSFAGEKMPWLTVHLALPLAFIAGHAIGMMWPALLRWLHHNSLVRWHWVAVGLGTTVAIVLLVLSLRTARDVSYSHPDTPIEPLIYTQTTPDVPVLAQEIERFVMGRSVPTPVVIDTTASLTWPWAWYLRHLPDVRYSDAIQIHDGEMPKGAVLISADWTVGANWSQRSKFEQPREYTHRWWFPEQGYKGTSFGSLLNGLRSGELFVDWMNFIAVRTEENSLGTLNGKIWFPLPIDGVEGLSR